MASAGLSADLRAKRAERGGRLAPHPSAPALRPPTNTGRDLFQPNASHARAQTNSPTGLRTDCPRNKVGISCIRCLPRQARTG